MYITKAQKLKKDIKEYIKAKIEAVRITDDSFTLAKVYNKLRIKKMAFYNKLNKDNSIITEVDLIRLSIILDFDLNELKELYK